MQKREKSLKVIICRYYPPVHLLIINVVVVNKYTPKYAEAY